MRRRPGRRSSVRLEPGVLALYAVSDKHDPAHVTVFYADLNAFAAHLATPHFRKYKAATQDGSCPSLRDTIPIVVGAKAT
jgi:quinol monooxygenase YgiN